MRQLRENRQAVAGERRGAVQLRLLALRVGHDGPHGGHVAQLRPPPGPLAHARQPAHAAHRHARQQVLHYTHELPPGHRHPTNYAITIIDKRVSLMKCRSRYLVGARAWSRGGGVARAHALWPRYHAGLRAGRNQLIAYQQCVPAS